jgi:uncharacterized protein involved in exopolysaccharide biosynthesis
MTPTTAEPEPRPSGDRRESDVDEISLLELANVLLKRWKLVAGLPLLCAFVAAVISLVVAPKYTATASFVPEIESSGMSLPGGLAGVAAQFGVSVPVEANSPAFYADVLKSRTLRDEVLVSLFPDPRSEAADDSATLLDILDIEGDSPSERLEAGREKLDGAMSVRVDSETGIVSASVESRYPALSADVANLFIDLLNRFNLETRQSNALERRRFIEERMGEAEGELRGAEDDLQDWLEGNRQYENSPELRFQYERLQRQVTIKQEVFTTLRRSYEEARIQEVNDTPVITVIDRAVPPEQKSSPKRKLNVILAFFLGGVVGVFGAFGREFAERARESDKGEYEEFTTRWAAMKAELRSYIPGLRRPT